MNATQLNKLAMYRAVHALLTNTTETNGIAALPAKLTTFGKKLNELSILAGTQSQPLRASIAERDAVLGEAVRGALAVAGVTLSYADEKNLGGLANKVRLKPTDFTRLRTTQRVLLAQQVHDAAKSVVAQLADHGITEPTLADLQAKIDAATDAVSAPRSTTVAKKAATEHLAAVVRQIDAVLDNQIDPLILPLRDTKPEFHARYKAARIIVDRPGGRNAPEIVQPTPPATGTPPQQLAA